MKLRVWSGAHWSHECQWHECQRSARGRPPLLPRKGNAPAAMPGDGARSKACASTSSGRNSAARAPRRAPLSRLWLCGASNLARHLASSVIAALPPWQGAGEAAGGCLTIHSIISYHYHAASGGVACSPTRGQACYGSLPCAGRCDRVESAAHSSPGPHVPWPRSRSPGPFGGGRSGVHVSTYPLIHVSTLSGLAPFSAARAHEAAWSCVALRMQGWANFAAASRVLGRERGSDCVSRRAPCLTAAPTGRLRRLSSKTPMRSPSS